MTFEEQCAAARAECYAARAEARARINELPISALIAEFTAARQERADERAERRRALWDAPPCGGLSRPSPQSSGRARNMRYI
jgi:hypothetical protein